MAPATHIVGFRHFTFGEWREPGTQVDASEWPNRQLLEESGYLRRLTEEEFSAPPQPTPRKGRKTSRPKQPKRKRPRKKKPPTKTSEKKPTRSRRSRKPATADSKQSKQKPEEPAPTAAPE